MSLIWLCFGVLMLIVALSIFAFSKQRAGDFSIKEFRIGYWIAALLILIGSFSFWYSQLFFNNTKKGFKNIDHFHFVLNGFYAKEPFTIVSSDTGNHNSLFYNKYRSFSTSRDKLSWFASVELYDQPIFVGDKIISESTSFNDRPFTIVSKADSITISFSQMRGQPYLRIVKDTVLLVPLSEIKTGGSILTIIDRAKFLSYFSKLDISENLHTGLRYIGLFKVGDNFSIYFTTAMTNWVQVVLNGNVINPQPIKFKIATSSKFRIGFDEISLENNFYLNDADSNLVYQPVSRKILPLANFTTNVGIDLALWASNGEQLTTGHFPVRNGLLTGIAENNSLLNHQPVYLNYHEGTLLKNLQINAVDLSGNLLAPVLENSNLKLQALNGIGDWKFELHNSFNWEFNSGTKYLINAGFWWWIVILALSVLYFSSVSYFLFGVSRDKSGFSYAITLSIVSLSIYTLLFIKSFLYWRYKCFAPFYDMNSLELESFRNVYYALPCLAGFSVIPLLTILSPFVKKLKSIKINGKVWFNNENQNRKVKCKKAYSFYLFIILSAVAIGFIFLENGSKDNLGQISRWKCMGILLVYFINNYLLHRYSAYSTEDAQEIWWSSKDSNTPVLFHPFKIINYFIILIALFFCDIGFFILFLNFILFYELFYNLTSLKNGHNVVKYVKYGKIFLLTIAVFANYLFLSSISYWLFFEMKNMTLVILLSLSLILLGVLFYLYIIKRIQFGIDNNVILRLTRFFPLILTGVALILLATLFSGHNLKDELVNRTNSTRFRIAILEQPISKLISSEEFKSDNIISINDAASNQWFTNTFIDSRYNPDIFSLSYNFGPLKLSNEAATYNAQSRDLVASRFLLAEHGFWLLVGLLVLLFIVISVYTLFHELYISTDDFSIVYANNITAVGVLIFLFAAFFSIVLSASNRYPFFGQDLPFLSINSIFTFIWPSILLCLFVGHISKTNSNHIFNPIKRIYVWPLIIIALFILVFTIKKPQYNIEDNYNANDLVDRFDARIENEIAPSIDEIEHGSDFINAISIEAKAIILTDSLTQYLKKGIINVSQWSAFEKSAFNNFLTQRSYLQQLETNFIIFYKYVNGRISLTVNRKMYSVQTPDRLKFPWSGDIVSDTSLFDISIWDHLNFDMKRFDSVADFETGNLSFYKPVGSFKWLAKNRTNQNIDLVINNKKETILPLDSILVKVNDTWIQYDKSNFPVWIMKSEPGFFMKNFVINNKPYFSYPLGKDFLWAFQLANSVNRIFSVKEKQNEPIVLSMNYKLTKDIIDTVKDFFRFQTQIPSQYSIAVSNGDGDILSIPDFNFDIKRPDPNNKKQMRDTLIMADEGMLYNKDRDIFGNYNLLRLNPGAGSSLKPVVFSAIASQLPIKWSLLRNRSVIIDEHITNFGGYSIHNSKGYPVGAAKYPSTQSVKDYIAYSDNSYHANVLFLGSYPRQSLDSLLKHFNLQEVPSINIPKFEYEGRNYVMGDPNQWPKTITMQPDFGSDSSFLNVGLSKNFGVKNRPGSSLWECWPTSFDSVIFLNSNSRWVFPEYSYFGQEPSSKTNSLHNAFVSGFAQPLKGSKPVEFTSLKMLDCIGKIITLNRLYSLSFLRSRKHLYEPFSLASEINSIEYFNLMKDGVYSGMKNALDSGTHKELGKKLKQMNSPFHYYAKTGTTGDGDNSSKLLLLIISKNDLTTITQSKDLRKNKFFSIYFASQNGPKSQFIELQYKIIRMIQNSQVFKDYMQ